MPAMNYRMIRRRGERGFWALFLIAFYLLFLGAIAFVAIHFLTKFW